MSNREIQVEDGRDLGDSTLPNLDDYGLNPFEFRIYARIVRRSDHEGSCESVASMAVACKICEQVVKSSLRFLAATGMIERVSRPGQTTIYRLTPYDRWVHPEALGGIRDQCAHHPSRKVAQIRTSATGGRYD